MAGRPGLIKSARYLSSPVSQFFFKKWFSSINWPICAYSFPVSTKLPSSDTLPGFYILLLRRTLCTNPVWSCATVLQRKAATKLTAGQLILLQRLDYIDWNPGRLRETGGNILDEIMAIVPVLSWRSSGQTVLFFNLQHTGIDRYDYRT